MFNTPVYITDMGAAASAGGLRVNDAVILHDGLAVEEQGVLLAELLHPDERPVFIHLTAAPHVRAQSA